MKDMSPLRDRSARAVAVLFAVFLLIVLFSFGWWVWTFVSPVGAIGRALALIVVLSLLVPPVLLILASLADE